MIFEYETEEYKLLNKEITSFKVRNLLLFSIVMSILIIAIGIALIVFLDITIGLIILALGVSLALSVLITVIPLKKNSGLANKIIIEINDYDFVVDKIGDGYENIVKYSMNFVKNVFEYRNVIIFTMRDGKIFAVQNNNENAEFLQVLFKDIYKMRH